MNKELFMPKVMYFGLYNLLEISQQIMNSIFWEILHKEVLANYINDFVIPAKSKKELKRKDKTVLEDSKKNTIFSLNGQCVTLMLRKYPF